jgi:hypothetical protein
VTPREKMQFFVGRLVNACSAHALAIASASAGTVLVLV